LQILEIERCATEGEWHDMVKLDIPGIRYAVLNHEPPLDQISGLDWRPHSADPSTATNRPIDRFLGDARISRPRQILGNGRPQQPKGDYRGNAIGVHCS
jgi:hypothetical protein